MILKLHSDLTLSTLIVVKTEAIIALVEVLIGRSAIGSPVFGTEIYLEGGKTLAVTELIATLATHLE